MEAKPLTDSRDSPYVPLIRDNGRKRFVVRKNGCKLQFLVTLRRYTFLILGGVSPKNIHDLVLILFVACLLLLFLCFSLGWGQLPKFWLSGPSLKHEVYDLAEHTPSLYSKHSSTESNEIYCLHMGSMDEIRI